MKNSKTRILIAIVIATVLNQSNLFAQNWKTNSLTGNVCGSAPNTYNIFGTDATSYSGYKDIRFFTASFERMRLIGEPGFNQGFLGIGTTATAPPQSLLHLNSTTTGNLFRTSGPATVDNNWEFWTGTTRKARIYVPANFPNLVLQTEQGWSNILFKTYGNVI